MLKKLPYSDLSDAAFAVAMQREDIISPVIIDNRIEGENMILEKKTGGIFRYSNNVNRGWSNNMQILWSDLKQGDALSLSFISNEKRLSDAIIKFSKGPKYGIFKLSINRQDDVIIDSSEEDNTIGEYRLKDLLIEKGKNFLNIVHLSSGERNQIGIDCIELTD